jgi:hypothetical protein
VYKRIVEARSCNHCCCRKAGDATCSECLFVVLGIQHSKRMANIILSSVVCPFLIIFSTLSHERYDFGKKDFLRKMHFDFL